MIIEKNTEFIIKKYTEFVFFLRRGSFAGAVSAGRRVFLRIRRSAAAFCVCGFRFPGAERRILGRYSLCRRFWAPRLLRAVVGPAV